MPLGRGKLAKGEVKKLDKSDIRMMPSAPPSDDDATLNAAKNIGRPLPPLPPTKDSPPSAPSATTTTTVTATAGPAQPSSSSSLPLPSSSSSSSVSSLSSSSSQPSAASAAKPAVVKTRRPAPPPPPPPPLSQVSPISPPTPRLPPPPPQASPSHPTPRLPPPPPQASLSHPTPRLPPPPPQASPFPPPPRLPPPPPPSLPPTRMSPTPPLTSSSQLIPGPRIHHGLMSPTAEPPKPSTLYPVLQDPSQTYYSELQENYVEPVPAAVLVPGPTCFPKRASAPAIGLRGGAEEANQESATRPDRLALASEANRGSGGGGILDTGLRDAPDPGDEVEGDVYEFIEPARQQTEGTEAMQQHDVPQEEMQQHQQRQSGPVQLPPKMQDVIKHLQERQRSQQQQPRQGEGESGVMVTSEARTARPESRQPRQPQPHQHSSQPRQQQQERVSPPPPPPTTPQQQQFQPPLQPPQTAEVAPEAEISARPPASGASEGQQQHSQETLLRRTVSGRAAYFRAMSSDRPPPPVLPKPGAAPRPQRQTSSNVAALAAVLGPRLAQVQQAPASRPVSGVLPQQARLATMESDSIAGSIPSVPSIQSSVTIPANPNPADVTGTVPNVPTDVRNSTPAVTPVGSCDVGVAKTVLDAFMDTAMVKDVLAMDIPEDLVRKAIEKRILSAGDSFSTTSALLDAVFDPIVTEPKQPSTVPGLKPEEIHRLIDQRFCKICMEEEVCIVFMPCGHLACCKECSERLKECPICRATITQRVRAYLA